jgi:hypothetical protein
MTSDDCERLEAYEVRYEAAGGYLKDFSEDELLDFEKLVMPLAMKSAWIRRSTRPLHRKASGRRHRALMGPL